MAAPVVTDRTYDATFQKLKDLEAHYPGLRDEYSPTQRIGDHCVRGLPKVQHESPMLSIDNVFSLEQLRAWYETICKTLDVKPRLTVEPKLDGAALSLVYENGKLITGATRGDGQVGDDVTHNARTIRNIPLQLPTQPDDMEIDRLVVRGEVVITTADFRKVNAYRIAHDELPLRNPRNGAAGAIRQQDPQKCAQCRLTFIAHGIASLLATSGDGLFVESDRIQIELLHKLGFTTAPLSQYAIRFDDALSHIGRLTASLGELNIETDGIVLKVNVLSHRRQLGTGTRHPNWAIAYKWDRYEASTTLQNITYQVGKTGAITPVAELKPVEIAGTTVSRASLFNADEIERLDVRVGDTVVIEKAGKIIPHILRVDLSKRSPEAQPPQFPRQCPACQAELVRDGVAWYCSRADKCPATLKQVIATFVSRSRMDIRGLGPAVISQLVDRGHVAELSDLYRLTPEILRSLDKVGQRKADAICQAIEASKQRPYWRLLAGLNIPFIGETLAREIAAVYPTMSSLIQAVNGYLSLEQTVEGVGQAASEAVWRYLMQEGGIEQIEQLALLGLNMGGDPGESEAVSAATPLTGLTIVATGKFQNFSRESINDAIRGAGGKPGSSVSKNTDCVVAGENAGSKLEKAENLGISILDEAGFIALLRKDVT